ncbi:MAG: DUF3618 domain-containing protein [Propionibacteriaceae bacterium]|jgi:hypothetical protein|nr:DUF3618 domain-containing protein [Propionibacteriaceae bacterium]
MTGSQDSASKRGVEDIQRDLAEARQRLSGNIGSLINEVHPKAVAHRTIDEAKATAHRTIDEAKATAQESWRRLKSEIKDDNGWRVDRLAAIAGGVVGVAAVVGLIRGVRR